MGGETTDEEAFCESGHFVRAEHTIDPRIKLFQMLAVGTCIFAINTPNIITLEVGCLALFLLYLGLYRQTLLFCLFYALVNAGLYFLQNQPTATLLGALSILLMLLRKMAPAIAIYMLFTKTMTVSELVAALERLRLPKALVLSLAIALRFVPTIQQESRILRDALRLRGRPVTIMNVLHHPIQMSEHVLVPFMMRGVKIADELSASAVTRGIECPCNRTSRRELCLCPVDWIYGALTAIGTIVLIVFELIN